MQCKVHADTHSVASIQVSLEHALGTRALPSCAGVAPLQHLCLRWCVYFGFLHKSVHVFACDPCSEEVAAYRQGGFAVPLVLLFATFPCISPAPSPLTPCLTGTMHVCRSLCIVSRVCGSAVVGGCWLWKLVWPCCGGLWPVVVDDMPVQCHRCLFGSSIRYCS